MRTTVDRRQLHFERDDEALAEVTARRAPWLEQQLELARLFCRIDRKSAFIPAGCGSVTELACLRGYDGWRAGQLCRLGYALEAEPELELLLRERAIGFAAACALGRIYENPEFLDPEDTWVRWARCERLSDLNRRISRRIESRRQERAADVPFTAHLTLRTAENVARCREIASRLAGRALTNGQLLDVFSTGYLLEHDVTAQAPDRSSYPQAPDGTPTADGRSAPQEGAAAPSAPGVEHSKAGAAPEAPRPWGVGSGVRRLPPTTERPNDRTVPAEVVRALARRSGGLCEFGSCERPAAEICHLVPHAGGSGREARDLAEGCRLHHKAYDAGLLRHVGWTCGDDPAGGDRPIFRASESGALLLPKPRPRPGAAVPPASEMPSWLSRALGPRLRRRLRPGDGQEARASRAGTAGPETTGPGAARSRAGRKPPRTEDAQAEGAPEASRATPQAPQAPKMPRPPRPPPSAGGP